MLTLAIAQVPTKTVVLAAKELRRPNMRRQAKKQPGGQLRLMYAKVPYWMMSDQRLIKSSKSIMS